MFVFRFMVLQFFLCCNAFVRKVRGGFEKYMPTQQGGILRAGSRVVLKNICPRNRGGRGDWGVNGSTNREVNRLSNCQSSEPLQVPRRWAVFFED